jgi:hypothetical protein
VKQPLGVTSRVPTVRGLDDSSHLLGSRTAKCGGRRRCANERKITREQAVLRSCDAFQADVNAASAMPCGRLARPRRLEIAEWCYPWPGGNVWRLKAVD